MHSYRLLVLTLLLAGATSAFAQEKIVTAPAPAKAATPPPAEFTWGGDIRLRYEAYDGVHTLNGDAPFHIRDYFRFRPRVWGNYNLQPNLVMYGRVAAEPRYWLDNSTVASEGKEWKYALLDNLYVKWNTPPSGDTPVTVVVGRQDIQLGDQWLVSDGTPIDGSWTSFFDAARVTLNVKEIKTTFEVIGLKEQAHPKDNFPILGRPAAYTITDQDEDGVILYATNKSVKNLQLDGYWIYKKDQKVSAAGNNGEVYTTGARVLCTPTPKWLYSAEVAYQSGNRDLQVRVPAVSTGSRDISAYGVNSRVTYSFKDAYNNQLTVLAEYLSGDDPSTTSKDEMFDNLWGRTPRVGETWAVAYTTESGGRISQYQNLFRVGGTWNITPIKDSSLALTYFAAFAPEETPTRTTNASLFSRSSHMRGHTVQVVAKQKFNKAISALVLLEGTFLGDYYTHHDLVTFVRVELTYTF